MAQLSDHFDTVQIFCTVKEEDQTLSVFDGSGNWYARYGQIVSWLKTEEKEFDQRKRTHLGEKEGDG
jgi:hypothetical protein